MSVDGLFLDFQRGGPRSLVEVSFARSAGDTKMLSLGRNTLNGGLRARPSLARGMRV